MNKLPEGWITCRFEDLLDYIQPTNYIVESTLYDDSYKTPVLTAGKSFIKGYTNETEGIYNKLPVIIFDDFTTASKYVNFPFKVKSSAMKILTPKSDLVNLKYVYYFMQTIRVSIDTHKRYWISEYSKFKIPLPPTEEQKEIVDKMEELLSDIDKGDEDLGKVQWQLKAYRQSVLKLAFEGKLINKIKSAEGLPDGWKVEKLQDVCDKIQDGSHVSPQIQYDTWEKNRYKYITAKNIRNDYMDLQNVTYVDQSFHSSIYKRCNPQFGDVLLTKDGANTGEVTLNTLKEEFSLLSSVCLFKTNTKILIPAFLKYYIQSPAGNANIVGKMTGTAIKRVVLNKIKSAEIVIPPIVEQNLIVQTIENRISVINKMEEGIAQSRQQAEALRQSILKKAFKGELVPQNSDNESAALLLEKLRREIKVSNEKEILEKSFKVKTNNMVEELKSILEILKATKKPVSSKVLWKTSFYKDDIDAFYENLKKHIDKGEVIEMQRRGKESFLKVARSK